LNQQDVRSLLAALEDSRDGYRDVVHRDKRLSQMDRGVWVARRDRAVSILAVAEERAIQDPEARRAMALGDWLQEEGLPESDPERVLKRMTELGEDEMERILQGYEARRKDWSETGPCKPSGLRATPARRDARNGKPTAEPQRRLLVRRRAGRVRVSPATPTPVLSAAEAHR
jgi:hypothetical protein